MLLLIDKRETMSIMWSKLLASYSYCQTIVMFSANKSKQFIQKESLESYLEGDIGNPGRSRGFLKSVSGSSTTLICIKTCSTFKISSIESFVLATIDNKYMQQSWFMHATLNIY